MTDPKLSFIVPAHTAGVPLIARFLRSLENQTAPKDWFEVVLGVDGGGIERAELPPTSYEVRLVDSPRGKDLPTGTMPATRRSARRAAPTCGRSTQTSSGRRTPSMRGCG